jgi:predicted RNase H-like nuclease (RuvC/YqgF family)
MDWSRFDRERFRKIMALALRADGAEALSALERARAHLEDAGGSIEDVLGGSASIRTHGAPEPRPDHGVPAKRTVGSDPMRTPDALDQALYASRIVAQLRTENRRLNDLLDQASRYIAELESEIMRVRRQSHGDVG